MSILLFSNNSVSSLDYFISTVDTATVLKGTAAEARPKFMEKGQRAGFRSSLLLFQALFDCAFRDVMLSQAYDEPRGRVPVGGET